MTFDAAPSHRWDWKTLGDVAKIVTGNTPSKKDAENYENDVVWARPADLREEIPINKSAVMLSNVGARKARVVPPKSVLVCCIGSIGKIGIAGVPLATNQQINAVVFLEDVLPKFGYYFLQNRADNLRQMASQAVVSIINKTNFSKIPFPVPALNEQHRIVDILNHATSIRRLREEAQRKAREIIPALFVEMFGDPATNPKRWPIVAVGKVSDVQGGLQVTRKRETLPIEVPYLRVANVFRNRLNLSEIKTIRVTQAEHNCGFARRDPHKQIRSYAL